MKFTVNKNDFVNALKYPSDIANDNNVNPILHGVYLEANNNQITLISSNGDISVKSFINNNLKIESSGKILIRGKILFNIVNKIKDETINFECVDTSILRISTKSFSSDINLMEEHTFPTLNFDHQG